MLAKDLGSRGITVNAVAPGPTNTDLFTTGKSEQLLQFFASLHPAKRIAEPDEISPVVAMLSREESVWVNGQTIFVNGVSYSSSIDHIQMLIDFSFTGLRSLEVLLCMANDLFRSYLPKIVDRERIEELKQ